MAAVYKRFDDVALRIIEGGATPHLQDNVRRYCYTSQSTVYVVLLCMFETEPDQCSAASHCH